MKKAAKQTARAQVKGKVSNGQVANKISSSGGDLSGGRGVAAEPVEQGASRLPVPQSRSINEQNMDGSGAVNETPSSFNSTRSAELSGGSGLHVVNSANDLSINEPHNSISTNKPAPFPISQNDRILTEPIFETDGSLARAPLPNVVEFPKPRLVEPATSKPRAAKSKPKTAKPAGKQKRSTETDELDLMLPSLPSGFWWETAANAKGFKIDLRWREGGKKTGHTFSRLGKFEHQSLLEESYEERCATIYDRLVGELLADTGTDKRGSHRHLADWLTVRTENNPDAE